MSTAKRQVPFHGITPGYRIAEADRYCCLLDEQPVTLTQEDLIDRSAESDDLVVNPELMTPDNEARLGSRFLNDWFSQAFPVVWVNDPVKGIPNPFWVTPPLLATIQRVRQEPECIRQLRAKESALLQQAGILLSPSNVRERRQQWPR